MSSLVRNDPQSRGVDKVYMATEYLAGGDLLDAIANDGEYNEDMARGIFRRVLRGVKYLHEEGITHRDMKARSVLYTGSRTTPFAW